MDARLENTRTNFFKFQSCDYGGRAKAVAYVLNDFACKPNTPCFYKEK
jgi:hypothetical protein